MIWAIAAIVAHGNVQHPYVELSTAPTKAIARQIALKHIAADNKGWTVLGMTIMRGEDFVYVGKPCPKAVCTVTKTEEPEK